MSHDDLLRRGYALALGLVALGSLIACAAVRGVTGWRWR